MPATPRRVVIDFRSRRRSSIQPIAAPYVDTLEVERVTRQLSRVGPRPAGRLPGRCQGSEDPLRGTIARRSAGEDFQTVLGKDGRYHFADEIEGVR